MDNDELRRSAALERRHWWYAERRHLIRTVLRDIPPGDALDVGTGPAGNTQVISELGWRTTGLEYTETGAQLAAARGLAIVRGDARALPFADQSFDLTLSTDVWEHIEEDHQVAAEAFRVTRPGGRLLLAVPAWEDLWSGHDVALGHVRRYEPEPLRRLVEGAGFEVIDMRGWNVLLRPVAKARRRRPHRTDGRTSEMQPVSPVLNAGLRAAVRLESLLPVQRWPGISLVVRARRTTG